MSEASRKEIVEIFNSNQIGCDNRVTPTVDEWNKVGAHINELTAQVEELKAALAHSTSVMCSLRKCYEEDNGLFKDTSKAIRKNNELLTHIGENNA